MKKSKPGTKPVAAKKPAKTHKRVAKMTSGQGPRSEPAQTFRKILCPVDFDDNSMAALKIACKVAAQNDASLCLLHVVEIPAHSTEMPPEALKPHPVWEREAKLKLDHIAKDRIPHATRCETFTRSGFPAGQIATAAADLNVDLIVMATHGHSRSLVKHLLLGSVAEHVIRRSTCPVLVVPPIFNSCELTDSI
jgi:nucleotide-binding universal stress UspA family protein